MDSIQMGKWVRRENLLDALHQTENPYASLLANALPQLEQCEQYFELMGDALIQVVKDNSSLAGWINHPERITLEDVIVKEDLLLTLEYMGRHEEIQVTQSRAGLSQETIKCLSE